jgi:hypothetical protein
MKPNCDIDWRYIIELPEWERKPAKEAKGRKPLKRRRWASKDSRAWAREKLHLQVRTLGQLAFWRNIIAKKGLEDPLLDL